MAILVPLIHLTTLAMSLMKRNLLDLKVILVFKVILVLKV